MTGNFPPSALNFLRTNPNVKSITEDGVATAAGIQYVSLRPLVIKTKFFTESTLRGALRVLVTLLRTRTPSASMLL